MDPCHDYPLDEFPEVKTIQYTIFEEPNQLQPQLIYTNRLHANPLLPTFTCGRTAK